MADHGPHLHSMRAMSPGQVVAVLKTVVQSCLGTAEVGPHICVRQRLTRQNAFCGGCRQSSVPEEPCLIDRMRSGSRHHAYIKGVVVQDLRNKSAGVGVSTCL